MLYIVEENGQDGTNIELFDGKKAATEYAIGLVKVHMVQIWGIAIENIPTFKKYEDMREYADNIFQTTRDIRRKDDTGLASIAIYEATVNGKKYLTDRVYRMMKDNFIPRAENFNF